MGNYEYHRLAMPRNSLDHLRICLLDELEQTRAAFAEHMRIFSKPDKDGRNTSVLDPHQ